MGKVWGLLKYHAPAISDEDMDWDGILIRSLDSDEMIPVFVKAATGNAYGRALLRLNAAIHDAHTAVPTSNRTAISAVFNGFTPMMPVRFRVLNGNVYVKQVSPAFQATTGLQKGSRILKINDRAITGHVALLTEHISAGRKGVLEHIINQRNLLSYMPVANDSIRLVYVTDSVQRDVGFRFDQSMALDAMKFMRAAINTRQFAAAHKGVWRVNDTTLYLNSGFWEKQFENFDLLNKTKKLIIDMRDYPNNNYNWGFLFREKRAYMTASLPTRIPGILNIEQSPIHPDKDYSFPGKVVVLISENSKSYPETIVMQLKAGIKDGVFIGRSTCGANGNVAWVPVVGVNKYKLAFSGLRVTFPDGTETQNVGIAPDIVVERTLEELLEDKDVILKRAIDL